ncbi:MAG: rRNA maturation RNase YbeY [Chloroflexota bacterium]
MPNAKYAIHVQIDEAFSGDVAAKLLRDAARAALKHEQATAGSLSIALAADETLRNLNSQFLGHDTPTDVLSFPSDSDDPDAEGRYFGDLIISYPRAHAQATAGGHPVEAELQLLDVHGVLHLLSHDHADEKQKAVMWQAQAEILSKLGCEITEPKK